MYNDNKYWHVFTSEISYIAIFKKQPKAQKQQNGVKKQKKKKKLHKRIL